MKGFGFLNCALCNGKRKRKDINTASTNLILGSYHSVDSAHTHPCGDSSIANKGSYNGSTKETLSMCTVSQLNNSHLKPDVASVNLTSDGLDASKVNLLPSDSCSVLIRQSVGKSINLEHSDVIKRLDAVVSRLERILGTHDLLSDDHAGIIMFNSIITENISEYVEVCRTVGEPAFEQSNLIKEAFQLCVGIMQLSRRHTKPSSADLNKLMQPLSFKLYEISDVANRNRSHSLYPQLTTIADSVSILSWINMSCSAVFVKDIENATKVTANATTQMYRETVPLYAEWMRVWLRVISSLREMVCDYYPVGLVWQSPGGPAPPPPLPPTLFHPLRPSLDGGASSDVASLYSTNSKRKEWRRRDGEKAFNRDTLLKDITRSRLNNLKHVEGFSYEA